MCFRPATTAKMKAFPSCGSANQRMRTSCIKCNTELESEEAFDYDFNSIIGDSDLMVQARKLAQRFAKSSANILLLGESGTGKELFAQAIHNHSRPSKPFIVLNCAAIPENLIESELFGYEGGAFTGAKRVVAEGKLS